MSTALALPGDLIANIVIKGDLSGLTPTQKTEYYTQFCNRVGLDPLTQPFKLLRLNGKEILYCDRSGAQQLNRKYEVSHEIVSREAILEVNVYQVTARAELPGGRHTDSIGAVSIYNLSGEAYANAVMKAETKAKRRATLDLLGLGLLDETEASDIPGAEPIGAPIMPNDGQNGAPAAGAGPAADPKIFKTAYDTGKPCWDAIQAATTLQQLGELYSVNLELIDKDLELTAAFRGKGEAFTKAGQQLPKIKQKQYEQLLHRVRSGDTLAAKKASAAYAFDDAQKDDLNNAFKAFQNLTEAVKAKYDNTDQLGELIEACTTEAMVRQLYANNAMIIDRTSILDTKYKNRLSFFAQAPRN